MENFTLSNKNSLVEDKAEDYVSKTIHAEEVALKKDMTKKRITLIGLGSLYVVLLLVSFTFLS